MAILVTGGAGYIGSHTVAELTEHGEQVVVLDDLRTGHREAVLTERFYPCSLEDEAALSAAFRENEIEAVVHFAADSIVPHSVQDPLPCYGNNLVGAHRLLSAMRRYGVNRIVFSSTASVYGNPTRIPIEEGDPTCPTNPYGDTKLAIERMLAWCDSAYGLRSVSLRYFNAAGAHPTLELGEDHEPETHLVPLVMQTSLGLRPSLALYGDDYDTADGTCVRDYVHVCDLARAHRLALQRLRAGKPGAVYNLGSGAGFTVKQVLDSAERVTGRSIPHHVEKRRAGDPSVLVASSDRARNELGWTPVYSSLDVIVSTAWRWHSHHPQGFGSQAEGEVRPLTS